MKRSTKVLGVMIALSGLQFLSCSVAPLEKVVQAAPSQNISATRDAINAAYQGQMKATANLDVNDFWSYRTSDFVWVSKHGKRKKAEQSREEMELMFNRAESLEGNVVIQKITLENPNKALVHRKSFGVVVFYDAHNRKNTLKFHATGVDTWVKRDGKWLCSFSKDITASGTSNGKPIPY